MAITTNNAKDAEVTGNYFTCIPPNYRIKSEWPLHAIDQGPLFFGLMSTINWFSSEPDSKRLQQAIADIQDFCPILGSRLQTGQVEPVTQVDSFTHDMKYVLDYSAGGQLQTALTNGIGYGEILDMDSELIERLLTQNTLSPLGLYDQLNAIFLDAVDQCLQQLDGDHKVGDDVDHHRRILQAIKGFPPTGAVSTNNPVAPLLSVIKLGSKDKRYWGIWVICNHCLFDGYGMFSIQKQLARTFADPQYLHAQFTQVINSDAIPTTQRYHAGLMLERHALEISQTGKPLLYSTDFGHLLARREKIQAIVNNQPPAPSSQQHDGETRLTPVSLSSTQIRNIANHVVTLIQPFNIATSWLLENVIAVESQLQNAEGDALDEVVLRLAQSMASGSGHDGRADMYGIQDNEDAQKKVVAELIEQGQFRAVLLASFAVEETKDACVVSLPLPSREYDEVSFIVTLTNKDVDRIKAYDQKVVDNEATQPEDRVWLSTNDYLMHFLSPAHLDTWAQVVGIRGLHQGIRQSVPANMLGNAIDAVAYMAPRTQNREMPLPIPFSGKTLRQLLNRFKNGSIENTDWMQHILPFERLLDKENFGILLNSWLKFSGNDWYPWEFGGKTPAHFIQQTHFPHLFREWAADIIGDADNAAGFDMPFRQIIVHKPHNDQYQALFLGVSRKDKLALKQRLIDVCAISSDKAETRFMF